MLKNEIIPFEKKFSIEIAGCPTRMKFKGIVQSNTMKEIEENIKAFKEIEKTQKIPLIEFNRQGSNFLDSKLEEETNVDLKSVEKAKKDFPNLNFAKSTSLQSKSSITKSRTQV